MSEKDTLIVLAASYDSVSDAEVDYEAVKSLYNNAGVGHDFDAAVLERGDDGKVKVATSTRSPPATVPGKVSRSEPWPRSCRGSVWAWAQPSVRGSAPSRAISRAA